MNKTIISFILLLCVFVTVHAGNIHESDWTYDQVGGGSASFDPFNNTFTYTHAPVDVIGSCMFKFNQSLVDFKGFILKTILFLSGNEPAELDIIDSNGEMIDYFYIQRNEDNNTLNMYSLENPNFDEIVSCENNPFALDVEFTHEIGSQVADISILIDNEVAYTGSYAFNNTNGFTSIAFGNNVNTDGNFEFTVIDFTPVAVVPEPSEYATIFGIFALGFILYRKIR